MKDHTQQLRQELLATGASATEIKELLPIASRLSLLKGSARPVTNGNQQAGRRLSRRTSLALAASGMAVSMLIVIISQTVLPTSPLYPVQKFSDSIAVYVHPRYRASVMMKRAQQVHQLVIDHVGSPQVLATLDDYTREASAYKSLPHANYAAFEYCKTNLRQAAAIAPSSVRQAIANSLKSLETT